LPAIGPAGPGRFSGQYHYGQPGRAGQVFILNKSLKFFKFKIENFETSHVFLNSKI